jgi:4-hydroxyproline epimerase
MNHPAPIEVIDSHTEGEPTRVVLSGWPLPAGETIAQRRDTMQREQDHLRRAVILEPRGHDAIVGALLLRPDRPDAAAGVVVVHAVSWLGMCGHGLIGVVRTLEHLGRIGAGQVEIDTPVGPVSATLEPDGAVTIGNVPA